MSSRKVHHDIHTIRNAIAESDEHMTELPPGRSTAILTGPQHVYVLT
jgi:peptidyl-tRNA hydrolase